MSPAEPTPEQQSKDLGNLLSLSVQMKNLLSPAYANTEHFNNLPGHFQEPKPVLRRWKQRCESQASLDYFPVSKAN